MDWFVVIMLGIIAAPLVLCGLFLWRTGRKAGDAGKRAGRRPDFDRILTDWDAHEARQRDQIARRRAS